MDSHKQVQPDTAEDKQLGCHWPVRGWLGAQCLLQESQNCLAAINLSAPVPEQNVSLYYFHSRDDNKGIWSLVAEVNLSQARFFFAKNYRGGAFSGPCLIHSVLAALWEQPALG